MFQNRIKLVHLKCTGSALKCSATQVRLSNREAGQYIRRNVPVLEATAFNESLQCLVRMI